jgi:hypothetical protein
MMIKVIFDSDGIIKIVKSVVANEVTGNFECFISDRVYEEAVIWGKDRLYEDAFRIEDLVLKDRLKVVRAMASPKAKRMLIGHGSLGEGEISTLHLFFDTKAKAIVSDDQAFLNMLYRNNVPFIIPSDLIARLSGLDILDRKKCLSALKRIRPYIGESNYLRAKNRIEVI